ncbi:hypothetical protein BZA77DRAFT_289314 [Pyronema omphalodes]|nr:hypothetical protein BZA77DRAFT_289314 [Pyronema omphalodes]
MTKKRAIEETSVELEPINRTETLPSYAPITAPPPAYINPTQPRDHILTETLPRIQEYSRRNNRDAPQTAARRPAFTTRRVNVSPPPKPRGLGKLLAIALFAPNGHDGVWFSGSVRVILWSIIYWIAVAIYLAVFTSIQAVKPTDTEIWTHIGFGVLAWIVFLPCLLWTHSATSYMRPARSTSVAV